MEQKLDSLASATHRSKSDLIKEALVLYLGHEDSQQDSYELGKDLFGTYGSGTKETARDYKALVKEKIRAKHNPH